MPKDKKESAPKPTRDEKRVAKIAKKEIAVIDMHGAKTVRRKTSWVKRVNMIAALVSVVWIVIVAIVPLWVKNKYSEPIKKSIVVSMFFDLQRNLQEQYTKMLHAIAGAIDLEKPIGYAVDAVKLAQKPVETVKETTARATDATAAATEKTGRITETTGRLSQLTAGIAGKLGVDTSGVDNAIGKVNDGVGAANKGIDVANAGIAKVDNVADQVNKQLDKVKGQLQRVAQIEIDKAIDTQVRAILDKYTGLGTTLLTDYGIQHVYPWRPSSWPVANKIYADLEKSSVEIISSLMGTVNKYFGYVAWGLVIAAWLLGLIILIQFWGKIKSLTKPFIVCPRCGHTFADARTGFMFLKVLQPWKWF